MYDVLGKDQYKVTRIDEKYPKGDKRRYSEYLVDLRNGDALCDCRSFYYTKKCCKHIRFILEQLRDGGGILDFNHMKLMKRLEDDDDEDEDDSDRFDV